jgi:hypothetical protein
MGEYTVNMNILAPKLGALHMGPRTQNRDFLDDNRSDFEIILVDYGGHLPKLHSDILR